MKSSSNQQITEGSRDTYENLNSLIHYFLPEYAKKMVWDADGNIRPISSGNQTPKLETSIEQPVNSEQVILSDPPIVLLCKHCLFAMQEVAIITEGSSVVAERFKEKGVLRGVVLGEITDFLSLLSGEMRKLSSSNPEEKAEIDKQLTEAYRNRKKQGTDAVLAAKNLLTHIQAIMQIATDANLPKETLSQLQSMKESLMSVSPQEYLSGRFPNLNNFLAPIMLSIFEGNRPAKPIEAVIPEQSTKKVVLKILNKTPDFNNYSAIGEPDSYVLIKEKSAPWKLVYLNRDLKPFDVDMKDVPNIKPLLEKVSSADKMTDEKIQIIKNNLASRWNPSLQERDEWFILIDPIRKAMSGALYLHELLNHYIEDAKNRGIELDEKQVDYIQKTQRALQNAGINKKGYYRYLEEGQETELSKNLKAMYNVIWAINQLSKGYWENPGTAAHLNMMKHAKKAYTEFFNIDWIGFNVHGNVIGDQIMNAMLLYGKDIVFPKLEQVARSTHEVELQQNLRFGVMLEQLRPLFDRFESLYQERHLGSLENPLGYSEKTAVMLQSHLETLQEGEEKVLKDFQIFEVFLKNLEEYEQLAQQINQPLPTGDRYGGSLPIVKLQEEKAQNLLFDLMKLKQTYELDKSQESAIDKVTNRLISDLTLDAKRKFLEKLRKTEIKDTHYQLIFKETQRQIIQNRQKIAENDTKSHYERGRDMVSNIISGSTLIPWPTEEFDVVFNFVNQLKSNSEKHLFEIMKYSDAIKSHKKMQKEYALRQLKAHGLVPLLETIDQNDPLSIQKQRKLAVIIADMSGESRSSYLKEAKQVVDEFVTNPKKMKTFLRQVYESDSALGHLLTVESVLAGHVSDVSSDILYSADKQLLQNDVIYILDRLNAKYIVNVFPENQTKDLPSQIILLIALLKNQPVTKNSLDAIRKEYSGDTRFNQESLVRLLVNEYQRYERALDSEVIIPSDSQVILMNKIGLFMGRLAHADIRMADIIFHSLDARTILKNEAVSRVTSGQLKSNSALYYESLVSTFHFNYYNERHEKENRSFDVFLNVNKGPILEIYKALHPHHTLTDDEIIDFYAKEDGQIELLNQLGRFTKTCLSSGSHAEQSMREFISSLLLCKDTNHLREVLLTSQNISFGAKNAGYLEFLTKETSDRFWELVTDDLRTKMNDINNKFSSFDKEMNALIATSKLPQRDQNFFNTRIRECMERNKKKLTEATEATKNIQNLQDRTMHCRFAVQELSAIRVDLAREASLVKNQLKSCQELRQLQFELGKIEGILNDYLGNILKNMLHAVVGNELLRDKQALVREFKEKFQQLNEEAKSSDANSSDLTKRALELSDNLNTRHVELLERHVGRDKAQKHSGRLGRKIELMNKILTPDSLPEGGMHQMIAKIGEVIKAIKAIRSKFSRNTLFHPNADKLSSADLPQNDQKPRGRRL